MMAMDLARCQESVRVKSNAKEKSVGQVPAQSLRVQVWMLVQEEIAN